MRKKRTRCKTCRTYIIANGKDKNGKQRYWCRRCKRSFHHPKKSKGEVMMGLFRQYVLLGFTYEIISELSGYSVKTLSSSFREILSRNPPGKNPAVSPKPLVLLVDGLWFNRWFVLMVYRESGKLKILHVSTGRSESKRNITYDFQLLQAKGYHVKGIVSDGGKPLLGAIQKVFPTVPHQVCMAHMQRSAVNAMGRHPKDDRVKFLKTIADSVWCIDSAWDKNIWSTLVDCYKKIYQPFLNEKRYDTEGTWWYIHKGPRKALTVLDAMYFQSFTFLDHPFLPKTTNEIEAQFGHLRKRWIVHRGMKQSRWEVFMQWFVYFYNKNLEDKKTV